MQKLIFDANRVADDAMRSELLEILFFRLAELDPRSALVLARTRDFAGIKSLEKTVWQTWARNDLEDALFEAKMQSSVAHENAAAQSLYAAFGYMGNETTERIESELGIGPDRASRGRFLYELADESVADAIAFINSLERGVEQREYVSWLAYYVSLSDPQAALASAPMFTESTDRQRFESIVKRNIARNDPQGTIERLLASDTKPSKSSEFHSAVRALASDDLEAVMRYYEQAASAEDRRVYSSAIVAELVKSSPDEALAWVDTNEAPQSFELRIAVLSQLASSDPDRAFAEALKLPNGPLRASLAADIVQRIARNDPAAAVTFLDRIPSAQNRQQASHQLASAWMRKDPDAATEWIMAQGEDKARQLLQSAAYQLLHRDLDKAIELLPKLDVTTQGGLRQQITERLATTRSPAAAQSFIAQFEGQPGFDQLQAAVIMGVAQSDVHHARQLADQLPNGNARDRAYVQLIGQQAQTDPVAALGWLRSMSDERLRGAAAGHVVTAWYAAEPAEAMRWVSGLPGGGLRDDVIMNMSSRWQTTTREQAALIDSIQDPDKRGQAKARRVYLLMRTDPAAARELLKDLDIPSNTRREMELVINQYGMQ